MVKLFGRTPSNLAVAHLGCPTAISASLALKRIFYALSFAARSIAATCAIRAAALRYISATRIRPIIICS